MRSISEGCNKGIYIGAFLAVGLLALAVRADDYTLAAGESATFSDGGWHTNGTITIYGNLTVSGNTRLVATNSIELIGGTVTIDGPNSLFGNRANGSSSIKPVVNFRPDDNGHYTKVFVRNGSLGVVSGTADSYNFSAKTLIIEPETEASRDYYANGLIDILDLDGAAANFYSVVNNTSLTGLVTAAGNSLFGRGNAYASGAGFYEKGPFRVEVASGANLRFNASNQLGAFNKDGGEVYVTGAGNLEFLQNVNTGQAYYPTSYKMFFRPGAVLDVTGTVKFDAAWYNSGVYAWFCFNDDNVFGPSIGTIKAANVSGNRPALLEVSANVTVTVHDIEAKRTVGVGDALVGDGTFRVDASTAARTVDANIPTTYYTNLVNNIAIGKFGDYEALLLVTNLPTLKVESGAVRFTNDCLISNLYGAPGTTLIADGCTITLGDGDFLAGGLSFKTENGGAFVKSSAVRTTIFNPGAIDSLRVADGNLIFSDYGLTKKYLRWTFTKTATSPSPLWLGRLWIFDIDGEHATVGMIKANDNTTASLAANTACWEYSSATNIARANSNSWQWEDRLKYVLGIDDLVKNMNNFFRCSSPVVDPENPDSWLGIGMRLADTAKPITGYNLMSGDSNSNYPVSWKIEASDDGTTWTEIETRSDVTHAKPGSCIFYDGETTGASGTATARGKPMEHFKFRGYKRDGLEADPTKPMLFQVDEGASVDLTAFTVAPQKIGGLTVDFATSGSTNTCGTIYGGSIAQGGTLTILNAGQDFGLGVPLPITLDGASDARNFGTWSVLVNGAEMHGCLRLNSDDHPVLTALATVLIFK